MNRGKQHTTSRLLGQWTGLVGGCSKHHLLVYNSGRVLKGLKLMAGNELTGGISGTALNASESKGRSTRRIKDMSFAVCH